MVSNQIAVADFMTTGEKPSTETKKTEPMKIPAFLNCSLTAKVNTVLYDNLTLKDVSGKLLIADQKVTLQNVKSSIFGGQIGMNGAVSTKEATPKFDMKLDLNKVDIPSTFTQLEMLKKIAPIAGIINGKMSSTINLSGNLDAKAMTPDLKSLTGNLLGQLLETSVNAEKSTLLSSLSSNFKFIDVNKMNLKDLKAALTFENGKVNVKPFDIKYQDIKATIGGSHGFDQAMNYNMKLDVPAKYLGNEATALLAKLSPADMAKLQNIPITALIGGNFSNPKVTTDMKTALTGLATQLVKQQKDKLVKEGTTKLGSLIDKNIKKPGDTTKTVIPTTKAEVKEAIKEKAKEEVTKKAGDLLNGLFGKKKE